MARRRRDRDFTPEITQLFGLVLVGAVFIPGFPQIVYGIGALLLALLGLAFLGLIGLVGYRIYQRRTRIAAGPASAYASPEILAPGSEHRKLVPVPAPGSATPPQDTLDLGQRLRAIDWFQFERLMAAVYRKLGYSVTQRGGANPDGGIDLMIEKEGSRVAVQCKHWRTRDVGIKTVREFLGAMTHEGIAEGQLLTLSGFTDNAKALAEVVSLCYNWPVR